MKEFKIPFKKWDLVAWINEKDGDEWVAVKPISDYIGLDWKSQHRKIVKNGVEINYGAKSIVGKAKFSYGHMTMTGSDGKSYKMLCLPVMQLNGWLYGINDARLKEDVRAKLIEFQHECHIAIYNHMHGSANLDVVRVLQNTIGQLQLTVCSLTDQLEEAHRRYQEQQVFNEGLKIRCEVNEAQIAQLASIVKEDDSYAGKRLAKTRHLKIV